MTMNIRFILWICSVNNSQFIIWKSKPRMTLCTKCNVFKVERSYFHYGVVIGKGASLFLQCIFGEAAPEEKNWYTVSTALLPIRSMQN